MQVTTVRYFVLLCVAVTTALVLCSWLYSGAAESYTPSQAGMPLPSYATPALLGAAGVTGLLPGALAWVTYQGEWSFAVPCPIACDGANTCVAAASGDGGRGCWQRGMNGLPGANTTPTWYVDSNLGNDSNACTTSGAGACLTLDEVLRRFGPQCIPPNAVVTIMLSGDFSASSLNWVLQACGGECVGACTNTVGYPLVVGTRVYTGADGGPLGTFIMHSYTSWSGSAHQEGVAYVVAAVDGGPGFDPSVFNVDSGLGLEDTGDGGDGGNAGLVLTIGQKVDAGTFYTAGGTIVPTFSSNEPSAGDSLRLFRFVQYATASGTSISIRGSAPPSFASMQVGSDIHAIQVDSTPSTSLSSTGFVSCVVQGLDLSPATNVYSLGSTYFGHVHVLGTFNSSNDIVFDAFEVRSNGYAVINGPALFGPSPVDVGCAEGLGSMDFYGSASLANYPFNRGYTLCSGHMNLFANVWCRNANGSSPSYCVGAGAGTFITYSAATPPASIGGGSAPWYAGGLYCDAGLPCTNPSNFSGIGVQQ